MLTLQALLITTSLLIVLSMVGAVLWLAALRVEAEQQTLPERSTREL
jgi:hypothetical protein